MADVDNDDLVAIVGMAGRFPGASDVPAFWRNLRDGVESIRTFSDAELEMTGADRSDPAFVPRGSVMDGVELFDAPFFGMDRREAELTDPQHRIFLETAWTAIEHAGYDPASFDGRIGVFGGVSANGYYRTNLSGHTDLLARVGDYQQLIATEREYAITRVAYKLGLRGPAVSVNTASSTSAVAIHLAVGSLLAGESDMTIAGGCRIRVPTTAGYTYQEDGILSPDGHCRPFDADARGTVVASGAALIALKRLPDAIADGDTIYALIRGTAINNDGSDKIGYTAPSVDGQAAVIGEALAVAGINAGTIGMMEAHGTGTSLGDPIEVAALTRAWRRDTDRRGYCAIGSLKSNLGHLDAAAGVAGVIKAALSLHHEEIPPTINFKSPNPQIDFESSPFFVNSELRHWPRSDDPRRAAVSSFGLGGTNGHIVLEEAPAPPASSAASRPAQLLTLSAKTKTALEQRGHELAAHLRSRPDLDLADVAYTLGAGRSRMPNRQAIVATDRSGVIDALEGRATRAVTTRTVPIDGADVAFLFPGQGEQFPGMAQGLYGTASAFKAALDECATILEPIIGRDLRPILVEGSDDEATASGDLSHAAIAQPATFAMSYSLARWWDDVGIRPAVMVGHSMGELTAACVAGVFDLGDALALIAERGRLSQQIEGGAMMAVLASPDTVTPLLDADTSIAAINAPTLCVASGPVASIDDLEARLSDAGIDSRRLRIEHAAHSDMLLPILEPFRQRVEAVPRSSLTIPIVSTVTGEWLTDEQAARPEYWSEHMRATVRFADAASTLLERQDLVLLEMGAGKTLTGLARRHPAATKDQTFVASLPKKSGPSTETDLMHALGQLWAAGVDVDWAAVQGAGRGRVELPTYPFERERYWVDPPADVAREERSEMVVDTVIDDVRTAPTLTPPTDVPGNRRPAVLTRQQRIAAELASVLADLSGVEAASLDSSAEFSDLGFDSLFLTQANAQFRKRFGVRITFRQLFEEAPSIEALASFIDERLDPDAFPDPISEAPAAPAGPEPTTIADASVIDRNVESSSDPASPAAIQRLIDEQLRIMEKQLDLVRSQAPLAVPADSHIGRGAVADDTSIHNGAPAGRPKPTRKWHYLATREQAEAAGSRATTDGQDAAIDDLVLRYNARTGGSKRRAEKWRPHLADNRSVVGFDVRWKELIYQIVAERSKGSRIWDVDGNEYIDTALGFGTDLLGHSPDIVVAAIKEQLERGYAVGVQDRTLGEVAEMITATTPAQRATFSSSGGDAVMTAIRIARTFTGRDGVAYFADSIHGRNDVVLGRSVDSEGRIQTVPLVAGVTQGSVDDTLVLEYGTDRALDAIRRAGSELAMVLVEPVQTRNPDLQPVEFLRKLQSLSEEFGFLLVLDEIVTGFRSHPGGVQTLFDIRADLTTYGKVVGGGMPIGVVAGRAELIDVIDGGPWRYGDSSFPEADITASGGTLIKHPLTLAATRAVLRHLGEAGPSLQEELNRRTSEAVAVANTAYTEAGVPIHLAHFSSFFRPTFEAGARFAPLFEFYLRERGVHSNPPSPSFISTAHSDEDLGRMVDAFVDAGKAMDRDGLLERRSAGQSSHRDRPVGVMRGERIPVLPNVARFLVERSTPDPNHWNLGVLVRPTTRLEPDIVRQTVADLADRHDAMRLRFFQEDGRWVSTMTAAADSSAFDTHDLSELSEAEQTTALEEEASAIQRSLDLERGPLFRVALFDLGERGQRLLVVVHHFASDGLSWRPFWEDFEAIYSGLATDGPVAEAPPSTSFREWAHALQRRADSDQLQDGIKDWLDLPWDAARPIPTDRPYTESANTNESAREVLLELSEEETAKLLSETPALANKTDLLMGALCAALADWTGSDTAHFDLMGHGRNEDDFEDIDLFGSVGFFISYTPIVVTMTRDESGPDPASFGSRFQPILRRGLEFDLLRYMTSDATTRETFGALPRAQVLFNHLGKRDVVDVAPGGSMFALTPEPIGETHSPSGVRYYPLAISSQFWRDRLRVTFVYSENLHERSTIERFAGLFRAELATAIEHSRAKLT